MYILSAEIVLASLNVEWISNICLKFKTTKCVPFQYSVVCFYVPIFFSRLKLFLVSSLQIIFYTTLWYTNSKTEEENKRAAWNCFIVYVLMYFFFRNLFEWFSFLWSPPTISWSAFTAFFCFVCDLVLRFTHI